jgi:hypothetical protein
MRQRLACGCAVGVLLLMLTACLLPPFLVRISCGRWPLWHKPPRETLVGLTRAEVRSRLGNPHRRYTETDFRSASPAETETWVYDTGWTGLNGIYVHFDVDGKADRVYDTP